jgi:hypothetical protein
VFAPGFSDDWHTNRGITAFAKLHCHKLALLGSDAEHLKKWDLIFELAAQPFHYV